jgi:hypothetical protein
MTAVSVVVAGMGAQTTLAIRARTESLICRIEVLGDEFLAAGLLIDGPANLPQGTAECGKSAVR